jgi:hypothetical protein
MYDAKPKPAMRHTLAANASAGLDVRDDCFVDVFVVVVTAPPSTSSASSGSRSSAMTG